MGFGVSGTAAISRSTNCSVQVAEQVGKDGTIEDMTTHGGKIETTEETYIDAGSFTNEATNAQVGTEVVSAHNLIESNTDYCRANKTTVEALASGGTLA